ncbi:MAG: Uma2 family endonuclease, partial [Planctomycetota bacterium]
RSPNDRPGLIDRKVAQYLAAGVARVWVIDPATRTLTVHGPDSASEPLRENGELREPADGVPPGFVLAVGELFTA